MEMSSEKHYSVETRNFHSSARATTEQEDANDFVVAEVLQSAGAGEAGNGPRLIVVAGPELSGKTTILRTLAQIPNSTAVLSSRNTSCYNEYVSNGKSLSLVDEIDRAVRPLDMVLRILGCKDFRGALVVTCEACPAWLNRVVGGYVLISVSPVGGQ